MSDGTVTTIKQLPAYMQEYDEALLARIFGTPDESGVLQGGLINDPDLFRIPEYVQAQQDPLQGAVLGTLDSRKERQAFMDRYQPYFMDNQGRPRFLGEASDAMASGLGSIGEGQEFFDRAEDLIGEGTGGVNARNIYDRELRDARRMIGQGTQGFDARGRGNQLFRGATDQFTDAERQMKRGLGEFETDEDAYSLARRRAREGQGEFDVDERAYRSATGAIQSGRGDFDVDENAFRTGERMIQQGQGSFNVPGGEFDQARRNLKRAGAGEFGAQEAFERGTDRAFQLAEEGLGRFDPTSVEAFMDPYKSQVIDAAMKRIAEEGAAARQGEAARAIGAGAFGGSRAGVQIAKTQQKEEEARAQTVANLMSQGFDKAMANAMATDEAARKRSLQASGLTGELGTKGASLEAQAFEDAKKRGLAAATTGAGLTQTEQQMRQKAFEDAKARGLTGAQLQNAVDEATEQMKMKSFESGRTRDLQAGTQLAGIQQQIQNAKQKAFEEAKSRGLQGSQLESYMAKAEEDARAKAYESAQTRDISVGQQMAGIGGQMADIGQARLGAEASAFADREKRILQGADMYRSMGLSSAEAEVAAQQDEYKRNLEAGRLTGGLGTSYAATGAQQADIGKGYGALAGTSADIGRVYAGMQPADMAFMYDLGEKDRQYRQEGLDMARSNVLAQTQQAIMPYTFGQGFLTGSPSSSVFGTFSSTPQAQTDPFLGGVGGYYTMQGLNQG